MKANKFPILVNDAGIPTVHVFVGFKWDSKLNASLLMFRCTQTGVDRVFGTLRNGDFKEELYGTTRSYVPLHDPEKKT